MEKTGSVYMEPKILGANIRKYRKQIGITQEQLAEKIGKSVNYIGMIERGEKVPSAKFFIQRTHRQAG